MRRVAFFAGFLLLASCGGGTPGMDHDLSGIVTDADTGQPVAGAMVTFSSDTLRTYDTVSGSDGVYRLIIDTDVPFGQVSAAKMGYVSVSASVYFDSSIRRVDLAMRALPMMMTP